MGPTTKSENLWRKLNSGHGLVTMDAVTFRAAFVGRRIEQVFLRTHLISSTVCVGHPGSEPEQCLCEIENLALPSQGRNLALSTGGVWSRFALQKGVAYTECPTKECS